MVNLDTFPSASALIESNDKLLGSPVKLERFGGNETPPEWWGKVRDAYLNAMNEMYRANTRAREGGRSPEAVRGGAIAGKGDKASP